MQTVMWPWCRQDLVAQVFAVSVCGAAVFSLQAFGGELPSHSPETLAGMQAYNRGDFAEAFARLSRRAEAGEAEAQVNLGYLYARGQGVPASQIEAFRLYALSAGQGNGEGMNALAFKYQFATGVTRDIGQAIRWYCLGVQAGNVRAMNNLANLLDRGDGVEPDLAQARSLWRQAAELGHANAMFNLASSLLVQGSPGRDPAQAMAWMLKAAEAKHGRAQAFLRAKGFRGALPMAADEAAIMIPTQDNAPGHAKICADATS